MDWINIDGDMLEEGNINFENQPFTEEKTELDDYTWNDV